MTYERQLNNWTETFLDYMDGIPSPEIYNKWTAYNIIAGALERRVWSKISNCRLYPNMITILVGPPAVGKSMAIKEANIFWRAVEDFNVAPMNVTKEIFMNQLGCKTKTFEYNNQMQIYNPLLIAANELSTLFQGCGHEFLNTICDLHDCTEYFERNTKANGVEHHDKPHLNMIIGTQPSYLAEIMSEELYCYGFGSRSVMVYSDYCIPSLANRFVGEREDLKVQLVGDLMSIANLVGEFTWEPEAQKSIETWNSEDTQNEAVKHDKFQGYKIRRTIHCIKLAMVMSVSRNEKLHVTLEDVEYAQVTLIEAEAMLPMIFAPWNLSLQEWNF